MNIFRLRGFYLIATGAIAGGLLILLMRPARPDEHAVLVPINLLFDGLAKRDASAIEASAIPGATFVSMQYGTLKQITFEQFAERVGTGTTHIDERIAILWYASIMIWQWCGLHSRFGSTEN
jgi:hypothetical protein